MGVPKFSAEASLGEASKTYVGRVLAVANVKISPAFLCPHPLCTYVCTQTARGFWCRCVCLGGMSPFPTMLPPQF